MEKAPSADPLDRRSRGGLHVAIIMDGNGRWARARGRRREWGHRRGALAVRKVVQAAPALGITTLTLYAFSADNWQRPPREVGLLMKLLRRYLRTEVAELAAHDVQLRVVGRRDRLDPDLVTLIQSAEEETARGGRLLLRLAVDYSSREALLLAMRAAVDGGLVDRGSIPGLLGRVMHDLGPSPDVDLLIRTGGEQRLSDFMLWECAYAELLFTPRMWPEFDGAALAEAVADFSRRERRFGRVAIAV